MREFMCDVAELGRIKKKDNAGKSHRILNPFDSIR
jgi:hypothetical protein